MGKHAKRKKKRIIWKRFIPFLLIVAILVCAAFALPKFIGLLSNDKQPVTGQERPSAELFQHSDVSDSETIHIDIKCIGDIMAHLPQINGAYNGETCTYEFGYSFQYISEYLQDSTLALGNFETTFPGDGNYSGYPAFDCPDSLATAMAEAGLDVAITCNNHSLDKGLNAALRTAQVLEDAGMQVVGTRQTTSDDRSIIVEKEGVKFGIVAYTYETPSVNGRRTLNGSYMASDATDYLNTFRQDSANIDSDIDAVCQQIQWCKDQGADIIICYMHWGEEYQKVNNTQRTIAAKLRNAGADVIFASHPHILQGIETYQVESYYTDSQNSNVNFCYDQTIPVFYSMGNFISNQRTETLQGYAPDPAATEQGMVAVYEFDYCKATGEISNVSATAIPTWVERISVGGQYKYYVIPLVGDYLSNPVLSTSGHGSRARSALQSITNLLGSEFIYQAK